MFGQADPATAADGLISLTGTSYASPFVAGVAALIWAADPKRSAGSVEGLLLRSAHRSPDLLVDRYVNAEGAVRDALGANIPPFVHIDAPRAGSDLSTAAPV